MRTTNATIILISFDAGPVAELPNYAQLIWVSPHYTDEVRLCRAHETHTEQTTRTGQKRLILMLHVYLCVVLRLPTAIEVLFMTEDEEDVEGKTNPYIASKSVVLLSFFPALVHLLQWIFLPSSSIQT